MTRKDLLDSTIKKLFSLSGNYCAFPNCRQKMVENDSVIGEICHIEAAEEDGQRYNPNQSDDERRDFPNLILLCPTHHKITNNVVDYSVQRLKEMKAIHESDYTDKAFVVSDEIVSSAINSYISTQLIQNLATGTQNITQSGAIYNFGINTRDMIEAINQSNLILQDHLQDAKKETETKI